MLISINDTNFSICIQYIPSDNLNNFYLIIILLFQKRLHQAIKIPRNLYWETVKIYLRIMAINIRNGPELGLG